MKKIKYLQDRNPGVPGLIYKLEPEKDKERKLENVRKLWDCVIDINGVGFKDIYSKRHIENKYAIDHFIPWSYVANDELWNLFHERKSDSPRTINCRTGTLIIRSFVIISIF